MEFEWNVDTDFVFVDLQGFRNRHRFICKEFSLIDGDYRYHAIVKSPYSFNKLNDYFRRQATWAMNYFHGIKYDCGDVNIVEFISKVYPKIMNKKIVVRHPWKIAWLQYIFRNCGDLDCVCIDNLGVNMLEENEREDKYEICDYHNETFGWKKCHCTLATTLEMRDVIEREKTMKRLESLVKTMKMEME